MKNIYFSISKCKVAFSWILNVMYKIFFKKKESFVPFGMMLKKGMFDKLNV